MGVAEEYVKMLAAVTGSSALADLEQRLKNVAKEEENLAARFRAGTVSSAQLDKEIRQLAEAKVDLGGKAQIAKRGIGDFQENIKGLTGAVTAFFSTSGDMGEKLSAVAGHLPALLSGLGPIGPALSGLVPIIGTVISNWDKLMKVFGVEYIDPAKTNVEKLGERIKELESKPHKIAIDVLELKNAYQEVERVKNALAAIDKLRNTQSGYEKESGENVTQLFSEVAPGGAKGLTDELRSDMVKKMTEQSGPLAEARKKEADAVAEIQSEEEQLKVPAPMEEMQVRSNLIEAAKRKKEAAAKEQTEIQSQIEKTADTELGDIIRRAQEGTGADQAAAQGQLKEMLKARGYERLSDQEKASLQNRPEEVKRRQQYDELAASMGGLGAQELQKTDEGNQAFDAALQQRREAGEARRTKEGKAAGDVSNWFGASYRAKALEYLSDNVSRESTAIALKNELADEVGKDGRVPADLVDSVASKVIGDILQGIGADQLKTAKDEQKRKAAQAKTAAQAPQPNPAQGRGGTPPKIDPLTAQIMESTSIDEEAQVWAATLQQKGGMVDEHGRFRKVAPKDRQGFIAQRIRQYLEATDHKGLAAYSPSMDIARQALEKTSAMTQSNRLQIADQVHKTSVQTGMPVRELLGVNNKTQMNQALTQMALEQTTQAVWNLLAKTEMNEQRVRRQANLAVTLNKRSRGGGRRLQ